MKSVFRIAAASLTLAALAAVSAPVFAGPVRAELSVGTGYYSRQDYIPSQPTYEAPAPVYRYQDADGWRQQQWRENAWRERERREHYWREQNAWRDRQWQEPRRREHEGWDDQRDHDRCGGWR